MLLKKFISKKKSADDNESIKLTSVQRVITFRLIEIIHVSTCVYLENINLILAFIIYIISQPTELLNIYSAFIVNQYGNARGTFCYNR